MEVAPGIHRIEAQTADGRLLCCYLLCGDIYVLVDTGEAPTPQTTLWPYLARHSLRPELIRLVLITHADSDHFGGTSAVLERTSALVAAHVTDAAWIAEPQRVLTERYGQFASPHGIAYDAPSQQRLRAQLGAPVPVPLRLMEGDVLALRHDWLLQVLHLPGHTLGHLGLFDPGSGVALIGDAALGDGLRNTGGQVVIPPSYYDPQLYLKTLRRLEALGAQTVLTGHLPVLTGEALTLWLSASQRFVAQLGAALHAEVAQRELPVSLAELTDAMCDTLGPWPAGCRPGLARSVLGHVQQLEMSGELRRVDSGDGVPRWRAQRTGAAR